MTEIKLKEDSWRSNTPLLQEALNRLGKSGGGILYVSTPETGAEIGSVEIPDYVTLHINGGSTLLTVLEEEAYGGDENRCLIESHGTRGIGITGRGVINGRGQEFMEEDLTYIYKPKKWRPRLVGLYACEDILIRDITLRDAPSWTLHPTGCRRLNIEGITIDNDLKIPNCDGIDPDHCLDVRISNCVISCADDCIVIKNTKENAQYGPTKRITVTGCTLISTSAAIKIGTETVDNFSDIVITGCTITDSSRGIALQLRDQGNIERVVISNCTITTRLFEEHYWGRAEALYITALPRFGVVGEKIPSWNPDNRVGTIRDVTVSNLRCRGENGTVIYGINREDGSVSVEDIRLSNLDLTIERKTRWDAGKRDLRPCDTLGPDFRDPTKDPGLQPLAHSALSLEGTARVTIKDAGIIWKADNREGFGSPLYLRNNRSLHLDGLCVEDVQ